MNDKKFNRKLQKLEIKMQRANVQYQRLHNKLLKKELKRTKPGF